MPSHLVPFFTHDDCLVYYLLLKFYIKIDGGVASLEEGILKNAVQ